MLRVDGVVVCCTLSRHDCSVVGGCKSFTINPPSQLPDCCLRKDHGGLWLSSRGLGWASVYSGGGDAGCLVACFDLFVFEPVRFALLFRLFSVFGFWHRVIGGSSFWTGLGVCSGGS